MNKDFMISVVKTIALIVIAVSILYQAKTLNTIQRQLEYNQKQRKNVARVDDVQAATRIYLDNNEIKKAADILMEALEKDPGNPLLEAMMQQVEPKLDSQ